MPDDLTTPDALEVIDLPAPNDGEDGTLAMEPVANTAIARWYAVQVASSCEKKVKATLEQRGLTTVELDMSEIRAAAGSLTCCSIFY